MDKFICIETFIKSVGCGSFRKAASEMHQTEASISKRITRLESELGMKLLERNRAGLKLTDVGEHYYRICREGVASIALADQYVKSQKLAPSGQLKVVCNDFFSRCCIFPKLKSFLEKYPAIQLQVEILELLPDFSEHNMDILFGVGQPLMGNLDVTQKRLMVTQEILLATPNYLKKYAIKKPADLLQIDYIAHSHRQPVNKVLLDKGEEIYTTPTLSFNNSQSCIDAALQNLGFIYIKKYWAEEYLQSGRLIQILPKQTRNEVSVHAYYRSRVYPDSKIVAFLDFFSIDTL